MTWSKRGLGLLVLSFVTAAAGCDGLLDIGGSVRGSGLVVEESRPIGRTEGVLLAAPGLLVIEQGPVPSLWLEGEDNLLDRIRTWKEGRLLRIEVEPGVSLRTTRPLRYYLTVRDLDRLIVAGTGSVEAVGLEPLSLSVTLNGSGNARLEDVWIDDLSITISGSGGLRIDGLAERVSSHLSGSGPLHARYLDTDDASLHLSGSGSAWIRVRHHLHATVSGSGSVHYYGSPTVQRTVTGSGSVRRSGP